MTLLIAYLKNNSFFLTDNISEYCRKDKSLGVLSQKFLMMFLVSEVSIHISKIRVHVDYYNTRSFSNEISRVLQLVNNNYNFFLS